MIGPKLQWWPTNIGLRSGIDDQSQMLLLDEPSLGLMPKLVDEVFESIQDLSYWITIIPVNNRFRKRGFLDRGYVCRQEHVLSGTGRNSSRQIW